MKKYFMMAMAAISAMTITVSCDSDYEPSGFYSEVNISNSSVSLDTLGGTTSTEVYAENAWEIQGVPSWLTVSPLSGNAGKTIVNFSAESTKAGRGATLMLVSADKTQYINVIQGLLAASDATCAEIIAGPDSKKYRAKGICTAIANTSYGNWYLRDNTGEIYIYGTLDKNGKSQNFLSLGIEVGDEVTVEGPKKTYNGTVELVDVMVVRINKSLIKIESGGAQSFSANGGDFMVQLTVKGDGPTIKFADDATAEWIGISSIIKTDTTTNVTFRVAPNQAEQSRQAIINFTSKSEKSSSTVSATVTQLGAILEVPVSDFLAAAEDDTQYRVTGIITSLYTSDTKGMSFTLRDYSGEVLIYRAEGFIESGAKVGDIVTVVGKRTSYKDSPQMGSVTFEELKYPVTEISIADFFTKEDSKEVYYKVTGTLTKIDNPTYGNVFLSDGTTELYVYGCYPGYGATGDNRKNCLETLGIEVGDELTVIGVKSTFNGTPQVSNGIYFSHTKAGAGE